MAKASKAPLDEWEQLCKTILALVETSQGGIPLDIIDRDYEDMTGSTIPWQLYGFSSLEELLSATGTVAVVPKEIAEYAGLDKMNEVRGSCDRSLVVVPVKNPKTEHLQRLISKQRPSVVTRLGGVVPNSVQWSKEEREREMRQKMQQLKMDPSLMKRSLAIVAPMATINIVDDGPRANRPVDPSTSRQQQQQQVQPPRLQQPVERQLVASQQPLDHQLLSSQQPAQQQPLQHQLVATQQPVRRQLAESQQPAQWQLFQPVASQQPIQGRLFQPDVSQQPVRLQLAQQVATQQPVRRQLAASQQPAQRQLVVAQQPMPSISYPIEKRESPPPPVPVATFDRPESPLIRAAPSTLVQNMVGREPAPLAEGRQEERARLPSWRSGEMGETNQQVPQQLEVKLGPVFSLEAKTCVPKEFVQKMITADQTLAGFCLWDRLYTLLFHYARGKDWLLAEHLPVLYQHHFGSPLNLVGFSAVDVCCYLQEWVHRWFDASGTMRVRLRDCPSPKHQMSIWHSMIKKVHKEDMKNIRFAIQKKSQDHREHEEDVFELITAAVPPVSQALVRGGLHGPKLESVTRNKIFWLLFAHFPLEGIAMRQLPNAYQNKYDERLKDDQKSLIEQQMVDLLRFERKNALVVIARVRFSVVPIADEVCEFSGLTSAELQSLIDEDIRLNGNRLGDNHGTECRPQPSRTIETIQQPTRFHEAAELGVLVNRTREFLKQFEGGLWTERLRTMLMKQGHAIVDIEQLLLEIKPPVERKYLDNKTCWVRLAEHSRKPWDQQVNRTAAESLDYATYASVPYSQRIVQRLISNGNEAAASVIDDAGAVPTRQLPSVVRTRAAPTPAMPPTLSPSSASHMMPPTASAISAAPMMLPPWSANPPPAALATYVPTDNLIDFDADTSVAPSSSATDAVKDLEELLDLNSHSLKCDSSPFLIDGMSPPAAISPTTLKAQEILKAEETTFVAPSLSTTRPMGTRMIPTPRSGRGMSPLLMDVDDLLRENLNDNSVRPRTSVQRLFERNFNFGERVFQPRTEADVQTAVRAQEGFTNLYGLTRELGVVRLNELAEVSNRFNERRIELGEVELRTIYSEANNRPEFFKLRWKENEDVVLVAPVHSDDD